MRLVLFQPDIPQNTGAVLRTAACLSIPVDIVEPCGFVWSEPRLRRAGMDYLDLAQVVRHVSWHAFLTARQPGRLVLLTTRGTSSLADHRFEPTDLLVLGRESAGVPDPVHAAADITLRIPIHPEARSMNVAVTAGVALGVALEQTRSWPGA